MTAHKKKSSRKKMPPAGALRSGNVATELPEETKAGAECSASVGDGIKRKTRCDSTLDVATQGAPITKSALYLCCALFLLLGILLGSLLPILRATPEPAQQPQATQQPQPPAPSPAQNDRHFAELEQAVQKNPQNVSAWVQLGNHYFDADKPRDAVRAYSRALALKPDNPDVLTDMGIMYRQLGEFDRAMENFTQASKINPLHEQSRFNLGVVLFFDLNRKEEARKVWRALTAVNPDAKASDGTLVRKLLEDLK